MIELCTKRRMVISTIVLGIITILVLILEEKFASEQHYWNQSPTQVSVSLLINSSRVEETVVGSSLNVLECWLTEEFKIVAECTPCTGFEINSGSINACKTTGLKETVHCLTSGTTVFKSCSSAPKSDKIRFFVFESLMLLFTVLSFGYCKFRSSQLERASIKQIEKRLASGM